LAVEKQPVDDEIGVCPADIRAPAEYRTAHDPVCGQGAKGFEDGPGQRQLPLQVRRNVAGDRGRQVTQPGAGPGPGQQAAPPDLPGPVHILVAGRGEAQLRDLVLGQPDAPGQIILKHGQQLPAGSVQRCPG
jgi:hypothetical protein